MTTVVRLHKKSLEKHAHSLPFLVRQQTTSPSTHSWHTRTMTRTVNPQNNFIPTDKPEKNHFPMIYPVLSSIWSNWKRRRLSAAYSLFRKSWQLGFFGLIQIWQKVFTSGFPPLFFFVFALHELLHLEHSMYREQKKRFAWEKMVAMNDRITGPQAEQNCCAYLWILLTIRMRNVMQYRHRGQLRLRCHPHCCDPHRCCLLCLLRSHPLCSTL